MLRILALILVVANSVAFSSPTVYGPTGLIEMPTAESVAYKQFSVAFDYAMDNDSDQISDTEEDNKTFFYKVNLGSFENCELGILGGSFLDEGVFVNLKYFLMSNEEENPLSIAAGIEKLGSKNELSTYMVASKRFQGGLNGHFGFKAYIQNNLFASTMIGLEYFSDEKLSFLADITGEKNEAYVLNTGLKIFIDSDVSMRLYLIDLTKNRSAKETLFTFGVSLSKYI